MGWYHNARCGFRLTHVPTGRSVTMWTGYLKRPRQADFLAASRWLWSLVLHAPEPANPERKYMLCPRVGVEPFVEQGGRKVVVGGDAIREMFDGKFLPSEADR